MPGSPEPAKQPAAVLLFLQYLERGRTYPFLLVSNHPRWRVHANLDDVTWFREMEEYVKVTGPDGYKYEPVWVHPTDAGVLGLATGDVVKVYNERGAVLGGLLIGIVETFTAGYISSSIRDIAAFVVLVIVLIFRPCGLLGKPVQKKV